MTIKQEPIMEEQSDIRAQFFADLKRLNGGGEGSNGVKSGDGDTERSSSHAVTLKIRDDENSLQSGKRKSSDEGLAETSKERKLGASEEELDTSIKLETTSC